jgi:hypothetical protein
MNVKKVIIFIAIILVSLTIGFFAGRFSSSGKVSELETRANILKSELEEQTTKSKNLTAGLTKAELEAGESIKTINRLTGSNKVLIESNRVITEENNRITETLGDLREGVGEDQDRVRGLIEGMDYYINQGKKQD